MSRLSPTTLAVVPTAKQTTKVAFDIDIATESKDKVDADSKPSHKHLFMLIYGLLFTFEGVVCVPNAMYIDIQNALNTSTGTVSWMFSIMAMCGVASSLLSGLILDKFKETHRYLALVVIIGIIAILSIPFAMTINVPVMCVVFGLIGYCDAAILTCVPVFIFRAFPTTGRHVFFIACTTNSITWIVLPIAIQVSIDAAGHYYYPLISVCAIGLFAVCTSLCLPTPQHDELRAIRRKVSELPASPPSYDSPETQSPTAKESTEIDMQMDIERLARKVSMRLNDNLKYGKIKKLLVSICVAALLLHENVECGCLAFITVYCVQYLNVNARYGRYLISTYYFAVVGYRLMKEAIDKLGQNKSINVSQKYAVTIGFVFRLLTLAVLWQVFGDNLVILFVVFALMGFAGSPSPPGLVHWGESIMPMNGFVSGLFFVAYQGGIAIITPICGLLIDQYSAAVLPLILTVPAAIGSLLTVWNLVT
eukprot:38117_1